MSSSAYYAYNVFLSYYGIVIAGIGTVGNFLSFLICLRQKLRKTPTFVFLAVTAITDTISLYEWNFNTFYLTFYGYFFGDINSEACRLTTLMQAFSSQSSAFLLAALCIERLLSCLIQNWRSVYFKSKHAMILSLLILLVIFSGNIYLIPTLPYQLKSNSTNRFGICYSSKEYKAWRLAHTYVYSLVPFVILALVNIYLIYHVVHKRRIHRTQSSNQKQRSMTVSVIILTLGFILMTGPLAISGGYFLGQLMLTIEGRALHFSLANLSFTYHAFLFVFNYSSNKKFSEEVKSVLRDFKCFNEHSKAANYNNTTKETSNSVNLQSLPDTRY